MRPGLRALLECGVALVVLTKLMLLFRVRGRRAVSARTRAAMQREASTRQELAAAQWDIWMTVRALARAEAIWPLRVRCLQHSLALQRLLERHGVSGRLMIGSRMDGGELAAHAWIEVADYVLDREAKRGAFAPFRQRESREAAFREILRPARGGEERSDRKAGDHGGVAE